MTYIEFYDENAVENICACLIKAPDRVVFVGDSRDKLLRHAERYQRIFENRGHSIEVICKGVARNNLQTVVSVLSDIVSAYDNCIFDLMGGDEIYIAAVGIVFERFKDKGIQLQRFNINTGKIIDCDKDGVTIMGDIAPALTVEENIEAYGGDIIYGGEDGTQFWDLNAEFLKDIQTMWDICRQNPGLWNKQLGLFKVASKALGKSDDGLIVQGSTEHLKNMLRHNKTECFFSDELLRQLKAKGLANVVERDGARTSIVFKNEQVKRCLTKEGQILEMLVYITALNAKDEDGNKIYNDVMNGVAIDWDGKDDRDGIDTKNEIDVMMMHGVVPVFVSCKNGDVSMDELYKLNTVAKKFGGDSSRKVLVANNLSSKDRFEEYFRQRASDMGIELVTGAHTLSREALTRAVNGFWRKK